MNDELVSFYFRAHRSPFIIPIEVIRACALCQREGISETRGRGDTETRRKGRKDETK
ncbi:MAG TPA: hypothetical protein VGN95_17625 [Pyrinomonadaceae bacterium]|nr:hypothetical protein [Pyrinomonadaceae bacterium]